MDSDSEQEYTNEDINEIKRIQECNDYYKILGVTEHANEEEIKAKYKELALKFHSDKCKAPGSEEAMKKINIAKETLCDLQKRTDYDKSRRINNNTHGFDEQKTEEEEDTDHIFAHYFREPEPEVNGPKTVIFIKFVFFLWFIIVPFIAWMSIVHENPYSMYQNHEYLDLLKTRELGIHYYVKKTFWKKYNSEQIMKFESEIEINVNGLKASCAKEMRDYKKRHKLNQYTIIKNLNTESFPSCIILEKMPVY